MRLNGPGFLNLSDSIIRKIMKAFNYFCYINGKFPINYNLSSAPDGKTPDFISARSSNQKMLPRRLCKLLRSAKSHSLVYAQVFCVLNFYLVGDQKISKDAITEFYHNVLMQTLSKLNHKITSDFARTSALVTSINSSLQKMFYEYKKVNQKIELEKDKVVNQNERSFEEHLEVTSRINQDIAEETMIENKKSSFQKNATR